MIRVVTTSLSILLLSVVTAGATPPADDAIAGAVEEQLLRDPVLRARAVDVGCRVGVVTLTGVVDDLLAKDRATELAETVRGVRSIVNRIVVDPHEERTDQQIAEDVRQALLADPATEAYDLEVESLDGVVTLIGVVQSGPEEQLAVAAARSVSGVRDVGERISIDVPERRRDAEITAEVKRALQYDVWVEDADVTVRVDDGAVSLTGAVPSLVAKRRAERHAWVPGVTDVESSELTVDIAAADPMTRRGPYVPFADENVARAVRDAFLFDPRVAPYQLRVTVRGGIAYLRGSVDTHAARMAAGAVALDTIGVRRIKNYVTVEPVVDVSDETVRERIELAFGADAWLAYQDVRPRVTNGVVILDGTVESEAIRRRAVSVASRIGGVRYIDDRLSVRSRIGVTLNDAELQEDVESELYWSPFVDAQGISVEVADGIVTLTGVARTWAEVRAAERNAREAGATHVRNRLTVGHAPTRTPMDEG